MDAYNDNGGGWLVALHRDGKFSKKVTDMYYIMDWRIHDMASVVAVSGERKS